MILLVAGACGASGDSGVETPAATSAPPPAAEPAAPAPEPAEEPEPEPPPPEPEPAEDPEPEPPPPEPEPPPPEPAPPPPEPPEEPEAATDPPPAPAPAPEPQETSGDPLDEATIATLAARLVSAQESVTSTRLQVSMSVAASFPGEPPVALEDLPLMTLTEVGDLTLAEVDIAALMGGLAGGLGGGPQPPALPPVEMILQGETDLYLNLATLAALDPAGEAPWLAGLLAEGDGDLSDLWGFVDLAGVGGAEALAALGVTPRTGLQDDFVGLLAAGLPEGALLEARSGGVGEVAGIPTQEYTFVLDLAALSEVPDALGLVFGPDAGPGDFGASPGDFFGAPGASMPFEYVLQVDSEDIIRSSTVVVDIGAILAAVFSELAEAEGAPDSPEGFPEFEYVMSMRIDVVALNDPSLVVELPDPSLVVELPEFLPDAAVSEGPAY